MGIGIKVGGGGSANQLVDCALDVEVDALVALDKLHKRVIIADASDPDKMPCIGIVVSKKSDTSCYISKSIILEGFEDGDIEAKSVYYVSEDGSGDFQLEQPDTTDHIIHAVGMGYGSNAIKVDINPQDAVKN